MKHATRLVFHSIFEGRVRNQLSDALHNVTMPNFNQLGTSISCIIKLVARAFKCATCPFRSFRQSINMLEQRLAIVKGRVYSFSDLRKTRPRLAYK